MANLEFVVSEDWKKWSEENSWASLVPAFAKDENGQRYMRNSLREGSKIYKIISEDDQGRQKYQCNDCGSDIMGATIAHPIWDGPGPCSGGGQCHYEQVPYCQKCEEKPSFSGIPIRVP